ncbi:MAG: DUF624 domain-containing protein [Oscillospiraceae bacterium]|nr:DUF624 domain-containing protein [Oscillospiraceae bacterium]
MASLFKFNNYNKPGPGISKDAPKKKKIVVFFETFFRNFWKFISINLVYFILSIPVITNGLANVGISNITRNISIDKHSFGLSDFFDTIKKNWKQALTVGIINIFITIALIFGILFYSNREGILATVGLGFILAFLMTFVIMNFYIWTLMLTCKFSTKTLYKNCFKFVFINFGKNILCLLSVLSIYVGYALILYVISLLSARVFYTAIVLAMFLFLFTYPCYRSLMIQYCVFPQIVKHIIEPYYEEHPYDDIELRRDLGLEVPKPKVFDENGEEILDEEESVFED